jgi:hypothetical protein
MTLNVPNLDRLISYLEALPPEKFNIRYVFSGKNGGIHLRERFNTCGTAACIAGWTLVLIDEQSDSAEVAQSWLGLTIAQGEALFMPDGWILAPESYPLSRAIRTLKHLRAEFLRTGTVVVDWDAPEAVETQRKPWAPPVVIAANKPLPAELTRLVREPATVTEA